MAFRFEFDVRNKILLARFDGRLTDELMVEGYRAVRRYSTATDAAAGILDSSATTEFAVSAAFVRRLANEDPAMPNATSRPRIIVAPAAVGFGLARMFQITGEEKRPLLTVVHTLEEALVALGAQSPRFEPLD
jgi:hypothetical protein